MVLDSTSFDPVLVLPRIVPLVEYIDIAFILIGAEGDSAVISVIAYLESGGLVGVLIEFKDDLRGEA